VVDLIVVTAVASGGVGAAVRGPVMIMSEPTCVWEPAEVTMVLFAEEEMVSPAVGAGDSIVALKAVVLLTV